MEVMKEEGGVKKVPQTTYSNTARAVLVKLIIVQRA